MGVATGLSCCFPDVLAVSVNVPDSLVERKLPEFVFKEKVGLVGCDVFSGLILLDNEESRFVLVEYTEVMREDLVAAATVGDKCKDFLPTDEAGLVSELNCDRFLVELPLLRRLEERWLLVLPERQALEANKLEEVLMPESDDRWVTDVAAFFWPLGPRACRKDSVCGVRSDDRSERV